MEIMSKLNIYLFATGLLFSSCGNTSVARIHVPDEHLVTRVGDTPRYTLTTDDISIDLAPGTPGNYKFSGTYKDTGDHLYYGYNDSTHSIDIYSLSKSKFISSIKIEKEGVRGLADITGLFVSSPDSIFVFDNSFIGLINSNGSIIHRWPVNRNAVSSKKFFSGSGIYTTLPQVFFFDKQRGVIYTLFKEAIPPATEKEV